MCEEVTVEEKVLSSCPEGTYVRRSDQLVSFKNEKTPACPRMVPAATEAVQDPYQWISAVSIGVTLRIVVLYTCMYTLYFYQKKLSGRPVRQKRPDAT